MFKSNSHNGLAWLIQKSCGIRLKLITGRELGRYGYRYPRKPFRWTGCQGYNYQKYKFGVKSREKIKSSKEIQCKTPRKVK